MNVIDASVLSLNLIILDLQNLTETQGLRWANNIRELQISCLFDKTRVHGSKPILYIHAEGAIWAP